MPLTFDLCDWTMPSSSSKSKRFYSSLDDQKVDGTIETIPVKRDLVVLEESYARSSVINRLDRKYGLIHLPKFYVDFKNYKERNAARMLSRR